MSECFWRWLHERRSVADRARTAQVLELLLTRILPGEPYQYDPALSFLQPSGALDPADPVRVTLFFPQRPLAILVGTRADQGRYAAAQPFVRLPEWERRQERLAWIRARLGRYGCPYLFLSHDEPIDLPSLLARVRMLTGR